MGISVLEDALFLGWFLDVFGVNSVTPRGPLARAFWRYSLGWFLAMPELYPPN